MDSLHSTNLPQYLFIDVCLAGVVFCFSFVCLSVCLFILKTVSFVAQAGFEPEIILHLSPPVLDFQRCTTMPGLRHAGDQIRSFVHGRQARYILATSPVLTEHSGKASWTVSLLYPTTAPCATCSSWGGGLWTSLCCPNETVTHSCTPWLWFLLFLINCSTVCKVLLH